jgi:N-formylglutamate amidohydrolase
MSFRPFTLLETLAPAPLVVDSPHSGRIYPADFGYACPLPLLRQTEDFLVDELVADAVQAGATVLMAEFPRGYIDVNRAEDDIDPAVLAEPWPEPLAPDARTLQGLGLVRRLCKSGVPVYKTPLAAAEVQRRIAQCYRPYHAALQTALEARHRMFGACWLIDAHSMPGGARNDAPPYPDFVLGDRQGTSCDPSFTRRARDTLQELGYSVALNEPYKGMEIIRRHGHPETGRHALQLEINRRLYMHEGTLEKSAGFERLKRDLTAFFRVLAEDLMRDEAGRLAAE